MMVLSFIQARTPPMWGGYIVVAGTSIVPQDYLHNLSLSKDILWGWLKWMRCLSFIIHVRFFNERRVKKGSRTFKIIRSITDLQDLDTDEMIRMPRELKENLVKLDQFLQPFNQYWLKGIHLELSRTYYIIPSGMNEKIASETQYFFLWNPVTISREKK